MSQSSCSPISSCTLVTCVLTTSLFKHHHCVSDNNHLCRVKLLHHIDDLSQVRLERMTTVPIKQNNISIMPFITKTSGVHIILHPQRLVPSFLMLNFNADIALFGNVEPVSLFRSWLHALDVSLAVTNNSIIELPTNARLDNITVSTLLVILIWRYMF